MGFIENAAKMRTQDSWASPSAYLETTTASLKQQIETISSSLSQLQTVFQSEMTEQTSVQWRQTASQPAAEADVSTRPQQTNSTAPATVLRQTQATAHSSGMDAASSASSAAPSVSSIPMAAPVTTSH